MGSVRNFTCNKCDYTVQTSGGLDCGMRFVTNTYIYSACKKIVDILVGELGITYPRGKISSFKDLFSSDLDFYVCPECGSETYLIKWSNNKRPCPHCGGRMEIDPNGNAFCID